jgi:hypothetical protein
MKIKITYAVAEFFVTCDKSDTIKSLRDKVLSHLGYDGNTHTLTLSNNGVKLYDDSMDNNTKTLEAEGIQEVTVVPKSVKSSNDVFGNSKGGTQSVSEGEEPSADGEEEENKKQCNNIILHRYRTPLYITVGGILAGAGVYCYEAYTSAELVLEV